MAHISKTILDVMNSIKDQDYILPDIQRGYVWKIEQIENLFDSLLPDPLLFYFSNDL